MSPEEAAVRLDVRQDDVDGSAQVFSSAAPGAALAQRLGQTMHGGTDVSQVLGAHQKLTTCARIELTTIKTGYATWHALSIAPASGPQACKSLLLCRHLESISSRAATPRGGEPESMRRKSCVGGQLLVSRGGSFLTSAEEADGMLRGCQ